MRNTRQRATRPNRLHEQLQRIELGTDHLKRVLADAAVARSDLRGDAFRNKRLGHIPVHVVEPLDDAGFDGVTPEPTAAGLLELRKSHRIDRVSPSAPQRVHRRKVVANMGRHRFGERSDLAPRDPDFA